MSVMIGHASIDENGNGRNGQAGDQTGKEVCTRSWWDKGWNVLLRPSEEYAEALAQACEAGCANNNIGYDMNQRNTLHTEAQKVGYDLSKIVTKCETDCSAFMTVCAIAAGITALEYTGNAPTTSTMKNIFKATNKFAVLTNQDFLRNDKYVKRGDILVKEGSHTVMVLSNGDGVVTQAIPADLQGKDIRVVSANALNVRVAPMGSKLSVLSSKDRVNVLEEKDGWCRIEGWVSSQYLVKMK